ncbi:hypothetical protein B0H13DRAFT_1886803 [Mycena leptocephala]|nr:hypothetical protein B0H13DRAFT_1886803 [Mycena leptocephala]
MIETQNMVQGQSQKVAVSLKTSIRCFLRPVATSPGEFPYMAIPVGSASPKEENQTFLYQNAKFLSKKPFLWVIPIHPRIALEMQPKFTLPTLNFIGVVVTFRKRIGHGVVESVSARLASIIVFWALSSGGGDGLAQNWSAVPDLCLVGEVIVSMIISSTSLSESSIGTKSFDGGGDFAAAVLLPHAAAVSGSQHVLDVETKSNHNCSGNLAADSGNQTQANILQRQSRHLQRQFGTLQPRLQRQSRSLLWHSHLFAAVINCHTAAIWRQYEHAAANVEHAAALLLVSAAVFFVRGNPHNGTHNYAAAVYVFWLQSSSCLRCIFAFSID